MALYQTLPIYKDIYSLTLLVFKTTKEFDKDYKYSLGVDMNNMVLSMLQQIYKVNKNPNKVELLDLLQDNIELFTLQSRLAGDINAISTAKRAEISVCLEKINKQIIGWKKSLKAGQS